MASAAARASEVVVYCALDEPYAAPVLKSFEEKTGIKVKVIYDSEAVKTAGLVNRIIAEKGRPVCDVFWNNEKLRTVLLAKKGLLEKFEPAAWKDRNIPHDKKNGLWSEFAARVRVIVYNPKYLDKLAPPDTPSPNPRLERRVQRGKLAASDSKAWLRNGGGAWTGKVAIANPLFGTTSTQLLVWMHEEADPEKWLEGIMKNQPIFCTGNSDVVRKVASGQAWIGYTDSDDALSAMSRGEEIEVVFPITGRQMLSMTDHTGEETEVCRDMGPIRIPNTIGIIKGCSHRSEAERLVNFVLSEEAEVKLADGASRQIPLGRLSEANRRRAFPFPTEDSLKFLQGANEEALVETLAHDLDLIRKVLENRPP